MVDKKQHVYIIGSKGIPAKYGGFETFVEKLTEYQVDKNIQYHVACMTENSAKSGITDKHFEHNGAKCFNVDVPRIGPARAIYYDIASLKYAIVFICPAGAEITTRFTPASMCACAFSSEV